MRKKTILIVEDEAIVAADLANKLERLGYPVAEIASEAGEAIESARRLRPDLALMDIRLKGTMDGIDAAEAIRNELDIPVVFLTAHSDPATLERAKIAQPSGYILKPFEERELASQIEMAMHKHLADRQVREQREWLRVTLLSIGDAVISTDADERVTLINPVAEALTGWSAEEADGRPLPEVFRVVDGRTGTPLESPVFRALREGKPVPLDNHAALVRRDGGRLPVEDTAAPILDAGGRTVGAVLVFQDVTEKRRAEEALRASEARYRSLAANLPNGAVFLVDRNLRYILAEGRALATMGLRPEDLEGRTVTESLDLPSAAVYEPAYRRTLDGEFSKVENFSLGRHYATHMTPLRNGDGEVYAALAVSHDITPLKNAERNLRTAHRKLRTAYEELFDFSEAVSHDLDGVIRAASHYAGFLHADLAETLTGEQRTFLKNLREVTRNGRYLIAELRRLAKLGNLPEAPIPIDFPAILRGIMALHEVDPAVEIVPSETWPPLRAQPRLIRMILSNLIGNAVKFNPSNRKRAEVGWQPAAPGRIELFVRDNGLGIDPAYHEHIFKIFKRLHTRKEYEGSGMGLAIIAKATRHLGGSVRLESELGRGSTFYVNLPESPGRGMPIPGDPLER